MLDDADTAPKKLGFDRAQKESYLFQSLLNGKALVAFGSDWPVRFDNLPSIYVTESFTCFQTKNLSSLLQVADINPLHSIRTAVKRIPPKWNHAWIPSECISFTDALTA